LGDSKSISEKRRQLLSDEIKERALSVSIGRASVEEIDALNVLQASHLAMRRAVEGLSPRPDHVLVDGNKVPDFGVSAEAIVQGDKTVPAISAASIVAKVARDAELVALAERYPEYGFESHKGYPTAKHRGRCAPSGHVPNTAEVTPLCRRPLPSCLSGAVRERGATDGRIFGAHRQLRR
jgi:ribonuclease HII